MCQKVVPILHILYYKWFFLAINLSAFPHFMDIKKIERKIKLAKKNIITFSYFNIYRNPCN